METREITQLKPHALNAEIYGDGCSGELRDLIATHGVKPEYALLVTGDHAYCGPNVIISGHRRYNAAHMAGLDAVPVVVSEAITQEDIEELLVLGNVGSRERTTEQKAREYTALKRVEEARAKLRQALAGGDRKSDQAKSLVPNLAPAISEGKSRAIAAEKVGMKRTTADKAAQVVDIIDTAKSTGNSEYAEELTATLNKSVDGAYKEVRPVIQATKQAEQDVRAHTILTTESDIQKRIDAEANRRAKEQLDELIARRNKPHVANNSGENEWYTPQEIIDAARQVLGQIDIDPASSEIANNTVKASRFYSIADDGLLHAWQGTVWMNPPYEAGLIDRFCQKYRQSVESGDVKEGIVLVNNATETKWFRALVDCSTAVVFPERRIRFVSPGGKLGAPLQGQALLYTGENRQAFLSTFSAFGWGAML